MKLGWGRPKTIPHTNGGKMRLETNDGRTFNFRHYEHFRGAVSKGRPRRVYLNLKDNPGQLTVLAEVGRLTMTFPIKRALKRALRNWISLVGLPLFVDGVRRGRVDKNNPILI